METRKFLNHSHPQTLQGATILFYFRAALGLLTLLAGAAPAILLNLLGGVAGYYIANDKKLGYYGGLVIAGVQVLLSLAYVAATSLNASSGVNLLFDGLLIYLLLHPMSRDYQRIWFK